MPPLFNFYPEIWTSSGPKPAGEMVQRYEDYLPQQGVK